MITTQPRRLLDQAAKDVRRYEEDVESWRRDHSSLQLDCWIWEDLISKANHLYGRIRRLDRHVRHADLVLKSHVPAELYDEIDGFIRSWLKHSLFLLGEAERIEREYGGVNEYDEFVDNIRAAKFAVAPDEFFDNENFIAFRDKAIDEYLAGQPQHSADD